MNLTCYIIDDEARAISVLADYINKTPGLELKGASAMPLVALDEISSDPPALLFLDVDMPDLNGLQVAGMVNLNTTKIFTTAYREYAVEAFEAEAADYLLKPISYERFLICIQKIRNNLPVKPSAPSIPPTIFVNSGTRQKLLQVNIADIIYISGSDHFIDIYFKEQKITTYMKLSEMLKKLPEAGFSRVHKSHIINHAYIHSLEPGQVKLQGNVTLPVGPAYKSAFFNKLGGNSHLLI